MKKQVFFIHGGEAYSKYENYLNHLQTVKIEPFPNERDKRWTDTLVEDLGEDYEVFTPTMPGKHNAKYIEWKIWFERHFEFLHNGVILVGYSQGGYFLIKYLVENEMPVQVLALYLVASPYQPDDFNGEDGGDFNFDTERLPELVEKVEDIHLLHSKDDFVVPYEHGQKLAAALPKATLHTFDDKNHFLVPELPELVAEIRKRAPSSK